MELWAHEVGLAHDSYRPDEADVKTLKRVKIPG